MQYDARKNDHGLPHDPFKAIVAPRPIGWIGSQNKGGQKNLAPKIAEKYNIPLVFYGEAESEYGNPIAEHSSSLRKNEY